MTMAPSVSYSITARLEVASHGRAVSEITRAVEQAGGVVTALDVNSGNRGTLRVDVTCAATDTAHAESLVAAMAAIPGVTVHKVSDRTFLLHLGGKIEMRSKVPLRNRDDLSMAYTPGRGAGEPRAGREARGRPTPDHQAQQRRRGDRRVRRARPGQRRPVRGAAGDGGQGRAVQAVRQHRRLADLPGHPGRRPDRRHGRGHRPRLRRDQPGGHLRAALLRGRAQAAGHARHPGVPRRPARHRDRRARRAHQRAARGRQGAGRRQDRHGGRGRGGHRRAEAAAQRGRQERDLLRHQRRGLPGPGRAEREPGLDRRAHQHRLLRRATWRARWSAPTCSSASPRRT